MSVSKTLGSRKFGGKGAAQWLKTFVNYLRQTLGLEPKKLNFLTRQLPAFDLEIRPTRGRPVWVIPRQMVLQDLQDLQVPNGFKC